MIISERIKISVIIPTYKPQKYILECFHSMNNQSLNKDNFEVIIILNGNHDPYYFFLEKSLLEYKFIYKLIYTDILGVSNARNIGIEPSKIDYLAFVDDDDIISENYLEGLFNITKYGAIPLSYAKAFVSNLSDVNNYYITNVYEKMINRSLTIFNIRSYFSSACYKLISREIIGTKRFDEKYQNGEDSLFMFSISKKNMKIQFAEKSVVYYRRIRKNSLTIKRNNIKYKIKNNLKLVFSIVRIYFNEPMRYSFAFFLSRIIAFIMSATMINKNHLILMKSSENIKSYE